MDQEVLTCSVCLNSYNSSTNRPFDLGCGHSFCEQCIKSSPRSFRNCPECRARASNPHANIALLRLLDAMDGTAGAGDAAGSSQPPSPTPMSLSGTPSPGVAAAGVPAGAAGAASRLGRGCDDGTQAGSSDGGGSSSGRGARAGDAAGSSQPPSPTPMSLSEMEALKLMFVEDVLQRKRDSLLRPDPYAINGMRAALKKLPNIQRHINSLSNPARIQKQLSRGKTEDELRVELLHQEDCLAAAEDRVDQLVVESAARKEVEVAAAYGALQRRLADVCDACWGGSPCSLVCAEGLQQMQQMQSWGLEQIRAMLCSVQIEIYTTCMQSLVAAV